MTIFNIISYDLKVLFRRKGAITNMVAFFVIISSLFPLALGPESETLKSVGIGVVWICALLSSTISLARVFEEDFESGILEQLYLQPIIPQIIYISKALSHWISSGLPIVVISPFILLMFDIEKEIIISSSLALALGSLIISFIGTMGAAVIIGIKRGAGLLSILLMPLYIPALVFGNGMSEAIIFGKNSEQFLSNMYGLLAIFFVILPLGLWSSSYSIKAALED